MEVKLLTWAHGTVKNADRLKMTFNLLGRELQAPVEFETENKKKFSTHVMYGDDEESPYDNAYGQYQGVPRYGAGYRGRNRRFNCGSNSVRPLKRGCDFRYPRASFNSDRH